MTVERITDAWIEANCEPRVATHIREQRAAVRRAQARADEAERRERDGARERERLLRRIAELESLGGRRHG